MTCHALLGMCLAVSFSASACSLDAQGLRAEGAFDRTLSVSGSVELEAQTGSGEIRIQTVRQTANGRADITSSSGNITVSNAHGPLRLRTASGAVVVNGQPVGTWSVRAASGNVTLDVGANAAFDLDAHSGSGRISSDLPVTITGPVSRRQLSGRVRGGGPRIAVSTSSGAIRIR